MNGNEATALSMDGAARDRHVDLLRLMVLGRELDRRMAKLDHHWHPILGEEAVVVGSFAALEDRDVGLPHYRGALIASLVRGADPYRLVAGAMGKATSPTRGRWRGDVTGEITAHQFGSFSGCLGPTLSYAAGAALAAKLRRSDGVSLVLFGDGTSNSGLFHESLNLASMLHLPAIFVCQNNQYAISTPARIAVPGSLLRRGQGYGMTAIEVDGNDALAVFDAVRKAVARGRAGEGPTFVHALTYRVSGHYASDPAPYRNPEELPLWAARDPVLRLTRRLVEGSVLTEDDVAAMASEAVRRTDDAFVRATADSWPGAEVLAGDAYAPA